MAQADTPERRLITELQTQVANHDRDLNSPSAPAVTEAVKARDTLVAITTPRSRPGLQRCPVSRHVSDPEDLEMDFTTPGVQGSLECPFAKMQHKLPITPNSIDPIAAEFHQEHISVQASDGPPNPSKCPIRFLDQHSPEEVAAYFENHKHEIPRSHEVCVKRYQQNEHSIRELDAKYGSLVNMIQGLGVKHKQYLPTKEAGEDEDADDEAEDRTSIQAVEKWAENVSTPAEAVEPEDFALDDEDRLPRFEKPLREVRVGESPSRPWGISVPVAPKSQRSVPLSDHREMGSSFAVPTDATSAPAQKASPSRAFGNEPLAKKPIMNERDKQVSTSNDPTPAKVPAPPPQQLVFNGPVFFGYTPEQATAFMQSINLGNVTA